MSYTGHQSGTGSGGTRNIAGTTNLHKQLERAVAAWHKKESALVFNSAYLANLTTLQTLGRRIPNLAFISDERNHASIIEGIRSSGAEKHIFRHNDTCHLEEILRSLPTNQPKCLVFESIYSMSGAVAPVAELLQLAKQYGAYTYVDEVHAVGLYGNNGAGICAELQQTSKVDIINGTFSKALGAFGGYIAASALFTDFVRSFGSGFIFTTSLPPAICATATAAIQHVSHQSFEREIMHQLSEQLKQMLAASNIPVVSGMSHITCIRIGNALLCRQIADTLLKDHGIYIQPVNTPTVPEGEECLRIIATAKHNQRHVKHLVHSLKTVLHSHNLLQTADGAEHHAQHHGLYPISKQVSATSSI
jgi:5-aminolevulinate synthase